MSTMIKRLSQQQSTMFLAAILAVILCSGGQCSEAQAVPLASLAYNATVIVRGVVGEHSQLLVTECYKGSVPAGRVRVVGLDVVSDQVMASSAHERKRPRRSASGERIQRMANRLKEQGLVGSHVVLFLSIERSELRLLSRVTSMAEEMTDYRLGVMLVLDGEKAQSLYTSGPSFSSFAALEQVVSNADVLDVSFLWNDRVKALGFQVSNISKTNVFLDVPANIYVHVQKVGGSHSVELPKTGWNLFLAPTGVLAAGNKCLGNYPLAKVPGLDELEGLRVEAVLRVESSSLRGPIEKRQEFVWP